MAREFVRGVVVIRIKGAGNSISHMEKGGCCIKMVISTKARFTRA
jgi:hypothetical protein